MPRRKPFPRTASAGTRNRRETGAIRKRWNGRISVALVYPNTYHVGMSNLGFQIVYGLLNRSDDLVCERAFLPDTGAGPGQILSLESGRRLSDFDIIAFSLSFESDYLNLLSILDNAGIPFSKDQRNEDHPLILAGGVACFMNPEPVADIVDVFLLGEAESLMEPFFGIYDPETDRNAMLRQLAREVPGCYVPAFYDVRYASDGRIASFRPAEDVPDTVRRIYPGDLSDIPAHSQFLSSDTTFDRTWLVETGRGCPHGCRFCSAGYIYRPPRFRPVSLLRKIMEAGAARTDRIGLMGAAVSDLPGIGELCAGFEKEKVRISFSSLRADALTPELLTALKNSGVKTATVAPEAGSRRMRRVISKGITETQILDAAEKLVETGIPNLKLYFMMGLPTETEEDIAAITDLCRKIKDRFLKSSRPKGRIGTITLSLNPFIPKPVTPFQWTGMDDIRTLKEKIRRIQKDLKTIPNVRLNHDTPKNAFIQALLARGDRRTGELLRLAHANRGNWAKTLKESPTDADFYVTRKREMDEIFPWDFVNHGVDKDYLWREYRRGLAGKGSAGCLMKEGCEVCGVCRRPATLSANDPPAP